MTICKEVVIKMVPEVNPLLLLFQKIDDNARTKANGFYNEVYRSSGDPHLFFKLRTGICHFFEDNGKINPLKLCTSRSLGLHRDMTDANGLNGVLDIFTYTVNTWEDETLTTFIEMGTLDTKYRMNPIRVYSSDGTMFGSHPEIIDSHSNVDSAHYAFDFRGLPERIDFNRVTRDFLTNYRNGIFQPPSLIVP